MRVDKHTRRSDIRFDSVVQIPPGYTYVIELEVLKAFKGDMVRVMDPRNTRRADLIYNDLDASSFEITNVTVGDCPQLPPGSERIPADMFVEFPPALSLNTASANERIRITVRNIGGCPRHFVADMFGIE